ncbi:putative methyltransferase [Geosmithia morbida]|uniref:Methyltransferase n=1 Tax=Geosmithia morbida TaxID=1094350 RepID=A0A9P5D842_9HYPO|nr:putative methyltransferase [Geosmithia morbida]KAF4125149.1 putative methyltransferase [Geosmithia morbida]
MPPTPEDLPQIWQRPSYSSLISALESLEVRLPVWNHGRKRSDVLAEQETLANRHNASATRYLSTIIGSRLSWLDGDEERDRVWDQASRRMAERCGRMAMGEVLRSWPFDPVADQQGGEGGGGRSGGIASFEPFELVIKEPGLTGDSLGLKTWASSYVLARNLPRLGATVLFRLFDESLGEPRPDVLELGSGTGLLGIAAAAVWKVPVTLTDMPAIVANLEDNADRNSELVERRGGSLRVGRLTWGGEVDEGLFEKANRFKIVLVADPLYDDNHPTLLASAIDQHLSLDAEARAVIMVPLRDETTVRLLKDFKEAMAGLVTPLACDDGQEEELEGQDDWDSASPAARRLHGPSLDVVLPAVNILPSPPTS